MPNTLAHIGIQALVSRRLSPKIDPAWIYLGCIIPDVPWILQRVSHLALFHADPFLVQSYAIGQASLIGCLPLIVAIAALSSDFRRIGTALAIACVGHLLLDALQTKWGNGVHFFAPFSWKTWNSGWFWPESLVTYGLTVFGFVEIFFWHRRFGLSRPETAPVTISTSKAGWVALCLLVYAALPLAFLSDIREADAHGLATLESASRTGREIAFDRIRYTIEPSGRKFELLNREGLICTGECPEGPGNVSARGVFIDQTTVRVRAFHEHSGWPRDEASVVGLILILGAWIRMLFARRRESTPSAR